MRYGVIGTGAVGGYYGAKLANAGQEVHFLLHKDYEHVLAHGLMVHSCKGDFHLPHVNAYGNAAEMPKCDVVFVSLKTINNYLLPNLLPPLLRPDTLVVLIQNGIGVEADVQKMFPGSWLAAGLAFICSAKTEFGVIRHQDYGNINIGNYSCKDENRIKQLTEELTAAGVATQNVEYEEARWKKAVWNMPFNGMTVALNTSTDQLLSNQHTRQLIRDLMHEVIEGAKACGATHVDEDFAEKMMKMTDSMTPYSPSMKLDFCYHRPMELHYLYSVPIRMAQEAGYTMHKLAMLEQELHFIQSQYS